MDIRKLKICMVTNMYYPYIGGISEHVFNLSNNLQRGGHIVKILTTNFRSKFFRKSIPIPYEEFVYRIGSGLLFYANKSFAQLPIGWKLSDQIYKIFQKEKFDIVHVHGALVPTLPMLALKSSKSINLITYHSSYPRKLKYLLFTPLLKSYHKKIHGRIAVSKTADMSNRSSLITECKIIPNGVDTELFNPNTEPLNEFHNDRPKILFVGRFEPRKGLKYLLKALKIIKKTIPDILLIIIGQGLSKYSYEKYVSREIKNNVKFVGLITGKERVRYYASCDVCCAPSIGYESFGIILLEAMSMAKPVVASDIAGFRTIIENGKNGLLSHVCSEKDIADKIIKILTNQNLAKTLGNAGRTTAMSYSWNKISKQIEAYYYKLIKDNYHCIRYNN